MPLPPPKTARTPRHHRRVFLDAYERDDGLWDIEARLTDAKPFDLPLGERGVHPAHAPIHDLHLRVTIDVRMNVLDVEAAYDAAPYAGHCDRIAPDYRRLVGCNLLDGFRHQIKARLGGAAGCTHLSELATLLPTAAVQAFAGTVYRDQERRHPERRPFQLDRCHALRTDGEVVRVFHPRWHTARATSPSGAAHAGPDLSSLPSSEPRIDR